MAFVLIFLTLAVVYLLLIRGRVGHPDLRELRKWRYAHRGLHNDSVPENSMSAFRAAVESGYGIELDVHLMQDGNLAVLHDSSLKRTAGAGVLIEDLAASDLEKYPLLGNNEWIPTLHQVLQMVDGRVPLVIELKSTVNNYEALCQQVFTLLDSYRGFYCVESFDPRCVLWLRKNRPTVLRGQLAQNFFLIENTLPWLLKVAIQYQLFNAFTKPDFIAYCYSDRHNLSNFLCRKLWKMQGVCWTVRSLESLSQAETEGWVPIFENIKP